MDHDSLKRRRVLKGVGVAGATALAGCTGNGSGGGTSGNGTSGSGGDSSGGTLNVLTWAGYEGIAKRIEEETGATVNQKLISSDVDGFNTLKGGGTSQFDVLLLDNTWAKRNARADTIKPVEKSDYPTTDQWMDQFNWPYETFVHNSEMYAVPPRWGWGGLGYDDRSVDLSTLKEKEYTAVWDGSFEGKLTLPDWPTWVIPLVIMQIFDIGEKNPMDVELSESQFTELEDTMVKMFDNTTAIHTGAAAVRQDMLQGNATLTFGIGNFGLSQLPAEGNNWMKAMYPTDVGGWYWTEGLCLVNNSDLNRDLANEYINACLTPEGQYSICWEDAKSKGAPVNTKAFDKFSEKEQKRIMMYKNKGFEASDQLLNDLVQYKISPQQDTWLDLWESAKSKADI